MNVIVVNDYAYVNGGAGQVAFQTAMILKERGHHVIFFSAVGPIDKSLTERGIEVVCLNQYDILNNPNRIEAIINGVNNKVAATEFKRILSGLNPCNTIIHIHSLQKAISTSIIPIANELNIKVIYHLHDYGVACPNLGFYDYQKKKICHRRPLSISCLICNCDRRSPMHKGWRVLRQYMQNHMGLPGKVDGFISISEFSLNILKPYLMNKPVYMLPNIIDVKKRSRVEVEKNKAFLYVGRLCSEKGGTLFAEAAKKLHVPAIFVGAGDEAEKIKRIYPEADMRGWLSHSELENVWREARALVFPSRWYEGQPLTVFEALAHGVPAIVPNTCAAVESILDGKNGMIFESGQIESLIKSMEKMMFSSNAERMGSTAYEKYWEKDWNEERYYSKLMDIYSLVLEN